MSKLALLLLFPFLASVAVFLSSCLSEKYLKRLSVLLSLIPLMILIFYGYNSWLGSTIDIPWFPPLSISFHFTIDPLSLLFVALTAVLIPIILVSVRTENISFPHVFFGFVLFLQGLLLSFFTARDLALFTIFWEAMLFPLYFLLTIWGKEGRSAAALKFLLYMIAGSAFMVAATLALYFASGNSFADRTFNLDTLASIAEQVPHSNWILAVFLLAFCVKTPLFPFHAWLPDAYYEASTPVTILLSALLSKAGIYGILRIAFPLFPDTMQTLSPWLISLAVAGVLYGGLAAWRQSDYKKVIIYSSLSHVNFILAGVFVWNLDAHEGAIVQAINHAITITALFLVSSWLEERLRSTLIGPFSGVVHRFPKLCWLTMLFVVSAIAVPGTNNFIGEFFILFGLFGENPWITFIIGLSIILSVMYLLRWMQTVYFDPPRGEIPKGKIDIGIKEFAIALPLVLLIFWIGIYPRPILEQAKSAAKNQVSQLEL